ncbi:hypothetical protein [Anaeromyxobacter terrae]|uniref:hypothetical protein n=1 Tax=Anaeromyxobacter terrae TaxID=2925406 RepID=UPI001F5AA846|nr:hypothetical protein [Anaeromyxobacter sp. SG22]
MGAWTRSAYLAAGAAALLAAACQREGGDSRQARRDTGGAVSPTSPSAPPTDTQLARGERERAAQPSTQQPATGPQASQQPPAAAGAQRTASGTVVSASAQEVVVRQGGAEPNIKLRVGADTPVLIDGQQRTVSDLKEGTQVRAAFTEKDGAPQAIRIEVQGGANAPKGTTEPQGTQQQR